MKILMVNTRHYRGGGDSTYTFNLTEVLRRAGHEVAFFAMQDRRSVPDPNDDLFVSHIDYSELNHRKNFSNGLRVLSRAIYSREARSKFSQLLDRVQPDIVHLQAVHDHITPSVIFEARKRGLPVVWTLHDYKLVCPNWYFLIDGRDEICEACLGGAYYHALLKRCKKGSVFASTMAALEAYAHRLMRVLDHVDFLLPPSIFLQNKLLEGGCPPSKVRHVPYVLPEAAFKSGQENRGYILFLGKLVALKGIFPLLDAARRAPEIDLVLAGRPDDVVGRALPGLLPPNARYVGLKFGLELEELLRGSLAVVVPSLWYENQPFSILEAFACGKPVITSNLGGMAELVPDRERGLLVPPGDAECLAGAMVWMTQYPDEVQAMGKAARRYALEYHGPERHMEEIMSIYEELRGR